MSSFLVQCTPLAGETTLSNFDPVQGLFGGDFGRVLDHRAVEDPPLFRIHLFVIEAACAGSCCKNGIIRAYVVHYTFDEQRKHLPRSLKNNHSTVKKTLIRREGDVEAKFGSQETQTWEGTLLARAHSSAIFLIRQFIFIIQ